MFFNLSADQASLDTIEQRFKDSSRIKGTNFLVLLLAIIIASVGLNINSVPVIIGAMLISPLMGPIIGIGYFTVRNDFVNLKNSISGYLQFLTLSVALSTIYFWISPIDVATSEILNRVNPTIWDAIIAFAGGIAGIIAITRKDFNNIFPGVTIATSLMPPLCTMGYAIAHLDFIMAINAFYLFFINSFFIALTTLIMINIIHIPEVKLEKKTKIKHYIIISVMLVLLIPSIIKGKDIISQEVFDVSVHNLIGNLKENNIIVLSIDSDKKNKTLILSLIEDEQLNKVDIKKFSNKYSLKLNLVKKYQEINIDKIKTELINEIHTVEKNNLNSKVFKLDAIRDDLKIINPEINDLILNKEDNRLLYIITKSNNVKKNKKIEELFPFIKKKLNNNNLNIIIR
ncbi:TIGR00341 family protein [archaeon]|nr:TIGR00341 family protein [archaeon]